MKYSERMVISAYSDGEVEAPWKSQVERKLADDPSWAAEAVLQARLKSVLAASPEPDFSQVRDRVLENITNRAPRIRPLPLTWLSAAAAALLVLAAGGGYWWGRQSVAAPAEVAELQVQVPRQLELKLSGEGQLLMASTLEGNRR